MTKFLTAQTHLLAKTEATKNVDSLPGVNDVQLAREISVEYLSTQQERGMLPGHFAMRKPVNSTRYCTISFTLELPGGGQIDNVGQPDDDDIIAPRADALLKACAFVRTDTGDPITSISYQRRNEAESCTIYIYETKPSGSVIRHVFLGCLGTMSFTMNAGEQMQVSCTMTGLSTVPTDVTRISPVDETMIAPVCEDLTVTFDSQTNLAISGMSFDLANTVAFVNRHNGGDIVLSSAAPTGSIDYDSVLMATYNPYTRLNETSSITASATVGSVLGNRVIVSIKNASYNSISGGDADGIMQKSIPLSLSGDANNEVIELDFT